MKMIKPLIICITTAILVPVSLCAETIDGSGELSANIGFNSDYIYRGIPQEEWS